MKKFLLILLLFSFSTFFAQNKYMIYFADKGGLTKQSLSKSIDKERFAEHYLSKKSIERRKKNLGDEYFTFEDLPIESKYLTQLSLNGIKIVNKLKWFNAVSAFLSEEELNYLESQKFIKKIEPIRKVKGLRPIQEDSKPNKLQKSSSTHNLNYGGSLTQNELSDIPSVHDMGITGEGVVIGLLDTGFDWEMHDALKERNVIAEYDFIFKDNETANDDKDLSSSQHNHGTSVFSIMAGFDEGNLIGPAFGSQFLLAKTEYVPSETHAEEDNYAAALEWMDSIGVDITSSSLGYSEFDAPEFSYTYADMNGNTTIVTKAAELAFDRGIVVITSAGNEGNDPWNYITAPGDGINTITVGAVTSNNSVTSFSSKGPTSDGRIKPEIVAMGSSVINAIAGSASNYGSGGGTSYSAPISAGIAGLLLSTYPHLTNKQIRSIMLESGDNVQDPDNNRGYGLISALKAITYPNLKNDGNIYTLHKIFDPTIDISANTVELVFGDGSKVSMIKDGNVYKAELPALTQNEKYEVYFNYRDSQNNLHREPTSQNYNFEYGRLFIDLVLTNVEEEIAIPKEFSLSQNYPNPFNPDTKINYTIPESERSSHVSLIVYDILGNKVKALVNDVQKSGRYSVDFSSAGLSSGVYFYQLKSGSFAQTKKLTILK